MPYQLLVADVCEHLGDAARLADDSEDTRHWFDKSLAIRKTIAESLPDNVRFQEQLSNLHDKIAEPAPCPP